MRGDSVLGPIVGAAVLLLFVALGVAHVLNPDRFIRHGPFRRGGEVLTEWNRLGVQLAGALIALAAGYILYSLAVSSFSN